MWRRIIIDNVFDKGNDGGEATYRKSEIKVIKPKNLEDAQVVSNCLRDKIPVIVNFEETEASEFKRVMDFISGTTYAVDGKMKQVSQKVFIFAPKNISVESNENKKSW